MRSQNGMTSLDTASVVFVAVILLALTADLVVLMYGFMLNDTAARDAARAAAATGSATSGQLAAKTAVAAHQADGYVVKGPTFDPSVKPEDFLYVLNSPDGTPYVSVTTHCKVNAPFAVDFFGNSYKIGQMSFDRSYTFPILGGSTSNGYLDHINGPGYHAPASGTPSGG